jgi:hypothetical protein
MNRRNFLKNMAAAMVIPLALKSVAAPVASTGVTQAQLEELIAVTLKDMPVGTLVLNPTRPLEWVNYYAEYKFELTELYCGKKTDKTEGCAAENSGIDRCAEVARDHLSVGQQRVSDSGWKAGVLKDYYPDGSVIY